MHESHLSLTPRLGISACLLGEPVRFNGGHKRSALCEELARHVEFISFCPEQAIGLATPRPAIRLEGTPEAAEARSRDGLAVGGALAEYARRVTQRTDTLDGFIFMQAFAILRTAAGQGLSRKEAARRAPKAVDASPQPFAKPCRSYRWKKKAGCTIRSCGKTSSPGCIAHAHWQALRQRGLSHSAIVAFHQPLQVPVAGAFAGALPQPRPPARRSRPLPAGSPRHIATSAS
ncbi:protein YbgA [Pseudomonas aeruginosa]|nr:protein YbgA [Pseudomonas aeruginosa]